MTNYRVRSTEEIIDGLQSIQRRNRPGSRAWVAAHRALQPMFAAMARAVGQRSPATCDCEYCEVRS